MELWWDLKCEGWIMEVDLGAPMLRMTRRDGKSAEIDLVVLQGLWTQEMHPRLTNQSNQLIEFTDGIVEILPIPTRYDQSILALLYELFVVFLRPCGGKVLFAPLRLMIRPGMFREPDLLLLVQVRDPRNQNAYWLGADLVLEIVSPDDPDRDLITKRTDYAGAGVPEYWIVNSLTETIIVLSLDGSSYQEHAVYQRGEVARSLVLNGFGVSVDAIFDVE